MNDIFIPYGVISTEYILPAAAAISCGAKLHDFKETGEEPCIRAVQRDGKTIKTIFQFHEMTSKGEKVKSLLDAYKQLDFGRPCSLPVSHTLCIAREVLAERHHLHAQCEELLRKPVTESTTGFLVNNTKCAAILSCLGHEIRDTRRIASGTVAFFFDQTEEIAALAKAFSDPWGVYAFGEDHALYHMKGALENRESLVVLLKRASTRVEVKQNGKRFFLPLNASKEELTNMTRKLNQ